jgi:hypothetical protein
MGLSQSGRDRKLPRRQDAVSNLFHDVGERNKLGRVWQARISRDVATWTARAYFVIPALDDTLELGPSRWQTRSAPLSEVSPTSVSAINSAITVSDLKIAVAAAFERIKLPKKGDSCLVIFDNDMEPWIISWWPYGG